MGTSVFVSIWLQNLGGGASSDPKEIWSVMQEQDFDRFGLLTFYHRAKETNEKIDVLQKEIDLYHRKFNALQFNEIGRRLIKDEWMKRYAIDQWGRPLPSKKAGKQCREKLNQIMFTVTRALEKTDPETERGAYKIDPRIEAAFRQTEFEVERALEEYTSHRFLLDEVEIKVARGETVTPETFKEAVEIVRRERIVGKNWDPPMFSKPTGAEQSGGRRTNEEPPERTDREPTSGGESDLLHDLREAQSESR